MDIHRLVKMANQIGDFFAPYPDRSQVVMSIATHLKNAWEPRMRRQIIEYVDQSGGPDLKPQVRDAILTLERPQAVQGEAPGDD
jgi:NADH-dependent formate dehydrogenase delta subunit FdsD